MRKRQTPMSKSRGLIVEGFKGDSIHKTYGIHNNKDYDLYTENN